jgi:hypothetical protein
MSLVGNSSKLDTAIRRANGGVSPNGKIPDQAHHLLSSNVVIKLDDEFESKSKYGLKLAFASGYLLNEAPNGIMLPTHFGHQRLLNLPTHRGNHYKKYYQNVENVLRPIYKAFKDFDVCNDSTAQAKLHAAFSGAENTTRSNIVSRAWTLYAWSAKLWDEDYRDEGTGNLYLNRPHDPAFESGLQWVDDTAGGIKRRYKKQKRKGGVANVVKTKWYSRYAYPPPPSIYS